MEILAVILVSLNLIIYSQICVLGAYAILALRFSDTREMLLTLLSLWLAVVIVIGIPLGLIKYMYPELDFPPAEIIKEVKKWNS